MKPGGCGIKRLNVFRAFNQGIHEVGFDVLNNQRHIVLPLARGIAKADSTQITQMGNNQKTVASGTRALRR